MRASTTTSSDWNIKVIQALTNNLKDNKRRNTAAEFFTKIINK